MIYKKMGVHYSLDFLQFDGILKMENIKMDKNCLIILRTSHVLFIKPPLCHSCLHKMSCPVLNS